MNTHYFGSKGKPYNEIVKRRPNESDQETMRFLIEKQKCFSLLQIKEIMGRQHPCQVMAKDEIFPLSWKQGNVFYVEEPDGVVSVAVVEWRGNWGWKMECFPFNHKMYYMYEYVYRVFIRN